MHVECRAVLTLLERWTFSHFLHLGEFVQHDKVNDNDTHAVNATVNEVSGGEEIKCIAYASV